MMFSPRVIPVPHLGASPYAPLSPAEQHAAQRCEPITKLPPPVVVDVWPVREDESELL